MMLRNKFFTISIYFCFIFFLTSCNDKPNITDTSHIPKFEPGDSYAIPREISKGLAVHIYFDATLSMQGFVNSEGPTHYKQMCRELKSVITVGGWSNEKVKYFKFGTKVEPISDEDYQTVAIPDFYETEDIMGQTFIDKVLNYEMRESPTGNIERVAPTPEEQSEVVKSEVETDGSNEANRLVIIVTDLFQDKGDINSLVAQLKEKYIVKGIEVGLLGFRSQFKGKVYDFGFGERSRFYESTEGESETYRPFYLLVLGKYADIANYFDNLIARGFDKAKTIIFSRYLVSPLLSFNGASIDDPTNLNSDDFVSPDPRLKQYEIIDDSKSASISAKMKYVPSLHAMNFNSDTFEVSIIAKCSDEEKTKVKKAQECLEVTSTLSKNEDGDELNIEFSLDSQSLPQRTVYLYEVTLSPNFDIFQVPEWCSEWDMGADREGSKTLNLVNFVRDLSLVSAQMYRPQIAKFYFYIKKGKGSF